MFSRREAEGYLEIDHRDSPGITPEEAARAGFDTQAIGKGVVYRCATVTCSNCERQVVLNPLRTRDRHWCSKCDAYHCDECALRTKLTGVCKTYRQHIEEWQKEVERHILRIRGL